MVQRCTTEDMLFGEMQVNWQAAAQVNWQTAMHLRVKAGGVVGGKGGGTGGDGVGACQANLVCAWLINSLLMVAYLHLLNVNQLTLHI